MIVGITGHRELQNIDWLKKVMQEIVIETKVTHGFTCLATGADELFAKILRQNNIGYTAVIPCSNYETTFEETSLDDFILSKKSALTVIKLDNDQPTEKAFNESGKIVVDNSEFMIAVWNGEDAKGLGGTGDIVEYAKSTNKKIIHLNPITKTITTINYGNKK